MAKMNIIPEPHQHSLGLLGPAEASQDGREPEAGDVEAAQPGSIFRHQEPVCDIGLKPGMRPVIRVQCNKTPWVIKLYH